MNGESTHYTLRELRDFAASRNFWVVLAAIIVLFTVIGPFGSNMMPIGPRFGFWLINLVCSTWIAITCVIIADYRLARLIPSGFARMLVGSVFSCLPIGAVLMLLIYSWHGVALTWQHYFENVADSIPLAFIFSLIFWAAMRHEPADEVVAPSAASATVANEPVSQVAAVNAPATASAPKPVEPPALLSRLKPENRAPILRLAAEDHYTLTVTARGRELLLIRFADALSELGATEGLQIHRSHWISKTSFEALETSNGKLSARLKDGTLLPVSRSFAPTVRQKTAEWA